MEWVSLRPQIFKLNKSKSAYPYFILMQEPKDMRKKDIKPKILDGLL
jgi:hypothetical protein